MKAQCWYNKKGANVVEDIKEGDESHLFMASGESEEESGNIWLIDMVAPTISQEFENSFRA